MIDPVRLQNGQLLPLAVIPVLDYESFADQVKTAVAGGAEMIGYFADREDGGTESEIFAVLGYAEDQNLAVLCTRPGRRFPSITPQCSQLHLFEREIGEQFGMVPAGHPWFKPVRFHAAWDGDDAWNRDPKTHPLVGAMEFFQVTGEEIHEVGVGPVHAGVIEPGHFRFQCFGENVLHLEISLGYQHRAVERLLAGGPWPQTPYQIETMAGDNTIGHMIAYSRIIEALAGIRVPDSALDIRTLALELERLANHVGDIGALAGDIGFLPTASFCGRLRGDYLNFTAALCGSRFGRGLVRPGGVLFNLAGAMRERMSAVNQVADHTRGAMNLFFETSSVLARLEGCGTVKSDDARALGLVGPAGRACGIDCDVRRHYPLPGKEKEHAWPAILEEGGDVLARARVRQHEIEAALTVISRQLQEMSGTTTMPAVPVVLQPRALSVGLVEGWRGRIAHIAITDERGRFRRYKVIDPSFFNWSGLAMALRDEQISDFPLCNKSFNLSYCGFDL